MTLRSRFWHMPGTPRTAKVQIFGSPPVLSSARALLCPAIIMHSVQTRSLFVFVAFALCVASSSLVGCGEEEEGCDFGGKHYSVGEEFDCDCRDVCRVCQADGIVATPLVECTAGAPSK